MAVGIKSMSQKMRRTYTEGHEEKWLNIHQAWPTP